MQWLKISFLMLSGVVVDYEACETHSVRNKWHFFKFWLKGVAKAFIDHLRLCGLFCFLSFDIHLDSLVFLLLCRNE